MTSSVSRLFIGVLGAAALSASLGLGGCTAMPDYYPRKGDMKPHPGVAKAKTYPIAGIDVSKWQGDVDWKAVREAGTKFAFIKATEGGDHMDEKFAQNWANAKAYGVPRGAYHFVYWCRPAQEQAAWFIKHIPQDPDALPPVLDVEWNGESQTCPKKIPREQALDKIRIMLTALERHTGKRPIIYTDITFHEEVLAGELQEYPFWIRSVAAEPHQRYSNRQWAFWQFTTTGRVPGIRGNVDRNVFGGTPEQWAAIVNAAPGDDMTATIASLRTKPPQPAVPAAAFAAAEPAPVQVAPMPAPAPLPASDIITGAGPLPSGPVPPGPLPPSPLALAD